MAFKVNARTILQLGEELISSDAVAFYELIKNSFDARSRRVDIDIVVRLPHELYLQHRDLIASELKQHGPKKRIDNSVLQSLKEAVIADVDVTSPTANDWMGEVERAPDLTALAVVVDAANYIEIVDTGTGMSQEVLEEVYLTIGTTNRQKQRSEATHRGGRPILGEKGLGRLSAMRLGHRLLVETTIAGDKHWNILDIDWRRFSNEPDDLLGPKPA